jgi:transposase, IS30 family
VSCISNELQRNMVEGTYDPVKAQHKAYVRRKAAKYQAMKIVDDTEMKQFIDQELLSDQSPEAISGRLGTISKDSIYRYIKSIYGREVEAYRIQKNKKNRRIKRVIHPSLQDRVFIDKRPLHINKRMRYGHMEGDFIVSGKTGGGVLLVVVDRKSRLVFLRLIPLPSCHAVHRALYEIQKCYPYMKSITLDNDILFQKHTELQKLLGIPLYFCHPYHSWEKGTVENVNKYIRRYIPKGSNLLEYAHEYISFVEEKCNSRYMKCLQYRTPQEVYNEQIKKRPL